MKRSYRPALEHLEERVVPTYGVPWPNAGQVTISFVPDGTQAGIGSSNLFQTLNAKAPTAAWQLEVLRAFQTWAANTNINITVVPDGGQPLGTAGAVQGDARFGDIRIAATTGIVDSTELADAQPFSWTGTTWSGDVVLNSAFAIGIGNSSSQYDLYSIMLHEAGHVFGFDHDTIDAGSVMNPTYAYHTQLAPADIASLQALYGVRQADIVNNGTLATATALNGTGQGASVSGDISTLQDIDYYKVQTPGFLSGFTGFNVHLAPTSLLTGTVSLLDSAGRLVASASATDALHGDLTLIVKAQTSSTYYFRVGASTTSDFGIGSYQLTVTNRYGLISLGNIVNTLTNVVNGTLGTALHLTSQNPGTDQRFDYFVQGNQLSSNGAEYYQVQSPSSPTGGAENMAAIVWGLDVNGLQGRLHLFDGSKNPVPVQVIANGGGTYTIQLPNAVPNATYYLEVTAANPGGANSTGRFALAIDFHEPALVAFTSIDSGTLTQAQPSATGALNMANDGLFHFALSASAVNSNAWVTMTVRDESGAVVLTLKVQAGQPTVTTDIYLKKGTYSISYSAATTDGSALTSISFQLSGDVISDEIGAYTAPPSSTSTSDSPSSPPSGSTGSSGSSGSTSQPPPPPPSYSYQGSGSSSSSQTAPASGPYYY